VSRRRKQDSEKTGVVRRKTSATVPQNAKTKTEVAREGAPTWIDALAREHGGGARRYLVVEDGGCRRVLISFATRELADIYADDEARWGTRCTVIDLDAEMSSDVKKRTG
jgi:hypothetical protein